jgi:hypothetical protein
MSRWLRDVVTEPHPLGVVEGAAGIFFTACSMRQYADPARVSLDRAELHEQVISAVDAPTGQAGRVRARPADTQVSDTHRVEIIRRVKGAA